MLKRNSPFYFFLIISHNQLFNFLLRILGNKIQLILSFFFLHNFNLRFLTVNQLLKEKKTHGAFILNVLLSYYRFLDDVIYMFVEYFHNLL